MSTLVSSSKPFTSCPEVELTSWPTAFLLPLPQGDRSAGLGPCSGLSSPNHSCRDSLAHGHKPSWWHRKEHIDRGKPHPASTPYLLGRPWPTEARRRLLAERRTKTRFTSPRLSSLANIARSVSALTRQPSIFLRFHSSQAGPPSPVALLPVTEWYRKLEHQASSLGREESVGMWEIGTRPGLLSQEH